MTDDNNSKLFERIKMTLVFIAIGGAIVICNGRVGNLCVYLAMAITAMVLFYATKIRDINHCENIGIVLGILILFGNRYVHDLLAVPVPGAFFEKESYEVKVIVYAGRSGAVSRYRIPATIRTEHEEHETGEDRYGQTTTSASRFYRLDALYMPNGGTVRFEDDNTFNSEDLNGEVELMDKRGDVWKIKISNELAK
jgi:hypothetical protein